MDQLPAKLKAEVCNFVEYGDLKVARQHHKDWADPATRALFEELWITQSILRKLEAIAHHERVCCVQAIVLHSEQIPQTIGWI